MARVKEDLTGQVFGRLTALEPTDNRYHRNVIWKCRCSCDNICEVSASHLRAGKRKSCGCLRMEVGLKTQKDITGQVFGRLTALEPTDKRSGSSIIWKCRCSCGNICEVSASRLKTGNTKSCGCLHTNNLTGQVFGRLTALEPTDKRSGSSVIWRCRCSCGNISEVSASHLKAGRTKSCGCSHINNLTGQIFGRLTALEPTDKHSGNSIIWKCRCSCGNICEVSASHLKAGNIKSCGCLRMEVGLKTQKDITGQVFGQLTALEPTDKRCGSSVIWKCRCSCGNICEVSVTNLTSGNSKSCGCSHINDLTGQIFGRLTALEPTDKRYHRSVIWKCRCSCGNICEVSGSKLKSGSTKSCGCLRNKK